MTNHKNPKRAKGFATTAVATFTAAAILAGSAGLASAADDTANLTQAEYAALTPEIDSAVHGKMTGTITNISIPDAAAAQNLKNQGFNIDFPKSVEASNAANTDNGYPVAVLNVTTDEVVFNATSPLASKIDLTGGGEPYYAKGLNFAIGDSTHHSYNFQAKADSPVPNFTAGEMINPWTSLKGQVSEGLYGADNYQLANVFPSSSVTDGGVANDLNGNTDSANSSYTQTWIADRFAGSAQRDADLSLDGAQRAAFASGLSSCVTAVQTSCGVWITPTASGLVTIDDAGTQTQGTVAIGESVWVEIKSTLAAQAPVHTESNPFVAESGDKVYFAPINGGTQVLDAAGEYNILNPSVAIKPWMYAAESELAVGWNSPRLEYLQSSYDGANFRIPVRATSPFMTENFTSTQTEGVNADNQIVTLTSTNDGLADSWTYNGSALVVGQTITINGTDGVGGTDLIAEATVVEASKGKLVLSFVISKPGTTFPFSAASIGTSNGAFARAASLSLTPNYEMKVIKADLPVEVPEIPVETPETPVVPEIPVETPETPVVPEIPADVPDSSTEETVIPDDAATDELVIDDLGESDAKATPLADTGANDSIILWSLAGLFALVAGGCAVMRARLMGNSSATQ